MSGRSNENPGLSETRSSIAIQQATQGIQRFADGVGNKVFVKSSQQKSSHADRKLAELADIIRTYRGVNFGAETEDEEAVRWIDGPWFDVLVCAVVLLNLFMISLEMDMNSKKGYDRNPVWIISEWLFCLAFVAEIALKVHVHSLQWFRMDAWSWVASVVSVFACVDTLILMPMKLSGDLRMFSMVRCIVLFRLARVIKHVKLLKELKQVLSGLSQSAASLFWSLLLLVLILYVFAIWTTTLVGHDNDWDAVKKLSNGWDNDELFGTIGKSMFTLLQMLTLDLWCSGITRNLVSWRWYMLFIVLSFLIVTTYGIINVILSAIVEQTVEAAHGPSATRNEHANEEANRELEAEIAKDIFTLANTQVSEKLTAENFKQACRDDPEVTWRLRQLELPVDDVMKLFQVMDGTGFRPLACREFVDGCTKMKGSARSKDLLSLQSQADAMAKQMDDLGRQLQYSERMLATLDETTTRMAIRLGHTVVASRRRLEARTRGTAPTGLGPPEKPGREGRELKLSITNEPRLPDLPNLIL